MAMTPRDNEVRNIFLLAIACLIAGTVVVLALGFFAGRAFGQDDTIWPQKPKRVEVVNKEHPGDVAADPPPPRRAAIPIKRPKFHTIGWEAKARIAGELGIPVFYWCDMTPMDSESSDEFFSAFPEATHLLVPKESMPTGKGRGSRVVFKGKDDWRWIIEANVGSDIVETVANQLDTAPTVEHGAWSQGLARPQPTFRQEPVVRQAPQQQIVRRGGG